VKGLGGGGARKKAFGKVQILVLEFCQRGGAPSENVKESGRGWGRRFVIQVDWETREKKRRILREGGGKKNE